MLTYLKAVGCEDLDVQYYTSEDGTIILKRNPIHWGYFKDGTLVDRDQYRHDLAERHNFKLEERV